MRRSEYYRSEAERVQQLAERTEPGQGREHFQQVASEYRTFADYYEALGPEAEPQVH